MKPSHESVSFGLIPKNAGTQWPTRKRAKIEHPTLSSASPVILEVEIARSDGLAVLSTDPRGIEISDVRRSSRTRARRGKSDENSEDCEVSSEASEQAKSSRISSKASEQAKSSRIGPTYQVSSVPPCGSEENLENHVGGDVLWDPEMAKKARLSGQDIDQFMTNNSHLPFPVKSLVMQAFHEVNYDTAKAQRRFVQVVQAARRKSTVCFPGGVDEGSVVTFGNQSHRNAAVPLTSRAQAVRQNPPTAASRNPTSTSRLTTLKGTSHDATAFPPRILGKASLVDTSNGSLQPQEAIGLKNRTLQETPATHPMENKALPTSTIDYACGSGTAVAPLNVVEATKYVHRGTNASFQPTNGSGVQAMFPNAAGIGIGSRGPEGNGDKSLLHAVGAIRNTMQGMLFCTI